MAQEGLADGTPVTDILLDTGSTRTVVREGFVQGQTGEKVSITERPAQVTGGRAATAIREG